ncbi:3-oxoacyl-[acyl-carrier-protein] synthase III C-terminal domain-containing protein [Niveispirillum fermenti]|uniref:3-oxoacyl-[acyl-carrier-protein] synthase III C-terminal domain-containing protein n=1 Tax=Niveispirillum fermenti TaxID=1233113 RepID=UPI003A8B1671
MTKVGISAAGAYVPMLRLQRRTIAAATAWYNPALASLGKGERSMANWDEDAVTMAVEAARDCLTGRDRQEIGRLFLAATTLPFADRQNAGIVKEALTLPDAVGSMDVGGSQRAGTTALLSALDAARAADASVLCLAADKRPARPASTDEFLNGDGAAALLAGTRDLIAELIGHYSVTVDFVDHYRASDRDHDYAWEGRWVRDEGYLRLLTGAIRDGLDRNGVSATDIDHLILALPAPGVDAQVAKAVGIPAERVVDGMHGDLGYTGAAHPLLLLARLLATVKPGKCIALAAFGQGVDLLLFRTTGLAGHGATGLGVDGWLARRRPEENYLKHLHFRGEVTLEAGMRAELDLKTSHAALYRDRKTVLGLVGGKCRVTGTVQYPKSAVSVARNARMVDTQDDHPLADRPARLVTVTADHLAFSPDPPSHYGMIDFDGGGRMIADIVDVGDMVPQPGARMRMMFRIKRIDARGFTQYFWKAAPDAGAPEVA